MAYLAADAQQSKPWWRWNSVGWLAKVFVHRECCRDDVDDVSHRCTTPEPTRAQVESMRRAVKALARSGHLELEYQLIEVRAHYRVPRAKRVYADDRVVVDAHRRELSCRIPLSVDECEQVQAHQHLRNQESDRRLRESIRLLHAAGFSL